MEGQSITEETTIKDQELLLMILERREEIDSDEVDSARLQVMVEAIKREGGADQVREPNVFYIN